MNTISIACSSCPFLLLWHHAHGWTEESQSTPNIHGSYLPATHQYASVLSAAGLALPVIAEGVGDIVLRFTEMFAPPRAEDEPRQHRMSQQKQLERQEHIQMAASAASKAPGNRSCPSDGIR